jgi:hypothetical protein
MALPSFFLSTRIPLVPDRAAPKRSRPGGVAPGQPWRLAFTMQPQQRTNWCWAATAVSIAAYYDPATPWTQCMLANAELGRDDCCHGAADCDVQWFLDDALDQLGRIRMWHDAPLSFEDVVRELDAGNPVCARIHWPDGSGHFVTVIGYVKAGGRFAEDVLLVADPELGREPWSYRNFRNSYRDTGKWTDSYRCK